MSQPDTLLDDLKRVAAAAPTFGDLLNRAANEIHGLRALLHRTEHEADDEIRRLRSEVATLRTIGFNDLARHEAEVATLQATATTYWNSLDDLIGLADEAIEARKASDDEEDQEMLDVYEERLARGRAALGRKPTT